MEKVFHFIVVPCCPMSKKTPSWVFCCVDRAGYFWGSWVFLGRMEKIFHLIVVPCCPISQSISPSWAFRGIDKAWYFWPAGYFGVGWRKVAMLSTLFHSFPFVHCAGLKTLPQVPIIIHAIAENGTRRLNNVITIHDQ